MTNIAGVSSLLKSCNNEMSLGQNIQNYFSYRPFKEAYFNYLGVDAAPFRERIITSVCQQLKAQKDILYLPSDASLLFYAVPVTFRSDILQEPFYKVPTCLPFVKGAFLKNWPLLKEKLPTGIYEIQKDFELQEEWEEYIRTGAHSSGTVIKMVLNKKNALSLSPFPNGITIRPAKTNDLQSINKLTKEYRGNYLFQSPLMDKSRTALLFQKWLLYSTEKLGSELFVLTLGNKIIGLINCMKAASFSRLIGKELGIIDFLIVEPAFRGKNYADYLLLYAVHNVFAEAQFIELQTSLQNYPAINFYSRHQFRILDTQVVTHFKILPERGYING